MHALCCCICPPRVLARIHTQTLHPRSRERYSCFIILLATRMSSRRVFDCSSHCVDVGGRAG